MKHRHYGLKRWGDFVIPEKRNDDEEWDNTDPYADSESDADSVQLTTCLTAHKNRHDHARPLIYVMIIMMSIVNPSSLIRGISILNINWTIV